MRDIIVTTPKSQMLNAALEAENCKRDGGGYYFRVLSSCPKGLVPGDSHVYYVEDGYIRGYAVVCAVTEPNGEPIPCDTTGIRWEGQAAVWMDARSWVFIKPIPMKGFQGWRYFDGARDIEEVGGWLDQKPEITPCA